MLPRGLDRLEDKPVLLLGGVGNSAGEAPTDNAVGFLPAKVVDFTEFGLFIFLSVYAKDGC